MILPHTMKIINYYLFAFFLFFLLSQVSFSQSWNLVWSDEFNGTAINDTNWSHEIGGNGWGNNELQYYTDRDTNSYLENGYLVIQALNENYSAWNYTSARLKSQGKRFFKYGKVLARIKLPYGKGIWPAFWMLGENFPTVGWPDCGEIDIVELVGGPDSDNKIYGTAHWENENGQHAEYSGNYTLPSGIFADNFHLFSIIWDEEKIKWYVDNRLYHEIDITPSSLSEFHEDFFIILNVAVGGNWPGSPDSTTVFPQKMYIDYIRVFEEAPTSVDDESKNPTGYKMYQNYPNPFNPSTKVKFSLAEDSHVKLKVFNSLGQEVVTITDQNMEAGDHSYELYAKDMISGVYFYRIEVNGDDGTRFVDSKKMVLLK